MVFADFEKIVISIAVFSFYYKDFCFNSFHYLINKDKKGRIISYNQIVVKKKPYILFNLIQKGS